MSDSEPQGNWTAALGRVPSGLFILTFGVGERGSGRLVSWVQQSSFEPPLVSLAINGQKFPTELTLADAPFVLNQVGQSQSRLIGHFGKGFDPGQSAFNGINVTASRHGPVILDSAQSYLECTVADKLEVGDHTLVIGRILGGDLRGEEAPYVHIRKSGLRY